MKYLGDIKMKLKIYLGLFFAFSFLSCDVHKIREDGCEVCGNYYFRYIDRVSVTFCGWKREAIEKLGGNMYVPEKIYNLNVVEIRKANHLYEYSSGYFSKELKDYLKGVKSIVIPKTVKIVHSNILNVCKDINQLTFQDASNWYAKNSSDNSWMSIDVSIPSLNVSKLKQTTIFKNIP